MILLSDNPILRFLSQKPVEVKKSLNARTMLDNMLTNMGYYDLSDEEYDYALEALKEGGEIVSKCTKGVVISKGNREAPAFVKTNSIKIGDNVQLLNWKPLGVRGAVIDLHPRGKVTKMYYKTLQVKTQKGVCKERRLEAVELDGHGPDDVILKSGRKLPYILKDSSVVLRFPNLAAPSGKTSHTSMLIN